MNRIARRRRQLSIDYRELTESWRNTRSGRIPIFIHAMSHGFAKVRHQFLTHYLESPPAWRMTLRQFEKDRALPDFCVIGPFKSGSSDLAVTIMSHPNVLHPLAKEFHFKDPPSWKQYYPKCSAVQRHARRYGIALCPLVSPCLHFLDTATSLSRLRPQTKVIINLRNPVDLVFSEWKWTVLHKDRRHVEQVIFLATFPAYVKKAIEVFPGAAAPFNFGLHNGIYEASVAHWLNAFGPQNVRVFDLAEYFNDREVYLRRLNEFVGLPHVKLPPRLPVVNRNPLGTLDLTPDASATLRDFFEPYNRRLWRVIGNEYPW